MSIAYSYIAAVDSGKPNGNTVNPFQMDVSTTLGTPVKFDVRPWSVASIQVGFSKATTTAVVTIYRSLDGQVTSALETAQTLSASDLMSDAIDVTGIGYLHVACTTAEASVTANVVCMAKAST